MDGIRGRASRPSRSKSARESPARGNPVDESPHEEPLTRGQIRELRRRMADHKNPVRYLLVASMGPRFALYYNISDDVYVLNDPGGATLFKRQGAALAVKRLLGRGTRVVRCTTRR